MAKRMLVLGVESSCDETAVALYDADRGLIDHDIYSQLDLHTVFGGVVPELAARDHARKCAPMIEALLGRNHIKYIDLDGISYTSGPGLAGALLSGACLAAALSDRLGIPSIGVHHLEGHLMAVHLEPNPPAYPFLALLVSGGHTQLVAVRAFGEYETLGTTVDDAVGEAFDKTAQLLGLPYPGGPQLEALAAKVKQSAYAFPRPMVDRPGLDFSFSGLKTHVANVLRRHGSMTLEEKAEVAHAFQEAVFDTLVIKCRRAFEQTHIERLVIGGGVGANQVLRRKMQDLASRLDVGIHYPSAIFCTDNAAMIAYVGCQRLLHGAISSTIRIHPRMPLDDLEP